MNVSVPYYNAKPRLGYLLHSLSISVLLPNGIVLVGVFVLVVSYPFH